jgi:hypothetical protein
MKPYLQCTVSCHGFIGKPYILIKCDAPDWTKPDEMSSIPLNGSFNTFHSLKAMYNQFYFDETHLFSFLNTLSCHHIY